jgi:hypothetical protein
MIVSSMTGTPCLGAFLGAIFAAVFGGRFFGVARFDAVLRAGLALPSLLRKAPPPRTPLIALPLMWPKGNAHRRLALCLAELLDASPSCGNVGLGLCVISITHVAITARGSEMTYLSHVVTQRPMLRVSGQILLAFCCATPLVLLLCFLV